MNERTKIFFGQDVTGLTEALKGRVIARRGGERARIEEVQCFKSVEVGDRYRRGDVSIDNLPAGMLWVYDYRFRRMQQALVTALDQGEQGACVRIVRASKFDAASNDYKLMSSEGDFAKLFGLGQNQVVQLEFTDDTEVLYLGEDGGSQKANQYLERLLGSS